MGVCLFPILLKLSQNNNGDDDDDDDDGNDDNDDDDDDGHKGCGSSKLHQII